MKTLSRHLTKQSAHRACSGARIERDRLSRAHRRSSGHRFREITVAPYLKLFYKVVEH